MADLIADNIAVGDKIYDLALGEGYVSGISPLAATPITITFIYKARVMHYNRNGELFAGANQTLYFIQPTVSPYTAVGKAPSLLSVNKGTQVYVSNDNITFVPAYLVEYIPSNPAPILALDNPAATATTATLYTYGRLTP